MAGQKLYPRATVKKIVKAHSNCNVSKNADVMVPLTPTSNASAELLTQRNQMFLDYMLFMQTLMKEAAIEAKQGGERGITARSVKKATVDSLAKFRG
ncbi:conserved hypothetical protein [Chaetomium globosum CBS 148.51]|uniref:Transcription factor CBF/NF-Y/archaeal histone domain-containing protein n=1 Tax=Chaetomium globosum (strain ATCC 6205 / CBS 148.51 / DSM 1962 / NBRC 6347 / NRRL 1970) TaxID=306901 RepID=Q2GV99_CHAGB|nr:uncharacterized protein CHGG_08105 [Chaetomium globosum CBS 148.51]EAQ86852.1 conserved hypothetical protein [Chaetomium globosum CBS 148.51]